MKKLLSFIAVTVTAATAVAAGAYIAKKLEQEKDEEVKLIEIINDDESSKETEEEPESSKEIHEDATEVEVVTLEEVEETTEELVEELVEEVVEEPEVLTEEPVEEVAEVVVEDTVEVVEELTEELDEEPVEEVVEEVIEEAAEEETTEELVEEVVEEETNPYPLLSERKITAICNQIQVMIESMEGLEAVDLQHYIVFPNIDATEDWLAEIEDKGFEIYVEENGQEVNLIKNSKLDYETLEKEILTLAQVAAEYTGAYKGWAVKVNE